MKRPKIENIRISHRTGCYFATVNRNRCYLLAAIHTHQYGTSHYTFWSRTKNPAIEDVAVELGIDFEPDRDETVEIFRCYTDMQIGNLIAEKSGRKKNEEKKS